jgi:membrane dipeptidase
MDAMLRLRLASLTLVALVAGSSAAQAQRAGGLHGRLVTLDTHLDTPANLERSGWDILADNSADGSFSQVDVPRMRAGGLDGGFWVIYIPQGPLNPQGYAAARDTAILRAMKIREMVARSPALFELATRAEDAPRIAAAGKLIVYQSMENSYQLGEDLTLLKTFYDLGVRMASPVHGANNQFADSATDKRRWAGLSPLGERWVDEMNRLGLVVDGSHASDEAIDQMIARSKTPIVLSHHGAKAVFDHPRNLDDERLKKVAASGGVIQMNSMYVEALNAPPDFRARMGALRFRMARIGTLSPAERKTLLAELKALEATPGWRGTFEAYMQNVLHVLKLVGPDHVGMGADWDGGGGVVGFESVADLPKITARLKAAGYSDDDLAKIWSGNVLRLVAQADAYRASLAAPPPAPAAR